MSSPSLTAASPTELAKAALRRLAEARQEPTPENFRIAYAAVSGSPATARPVVLEQLVNRACADASPEDREAMLQALADGQYAVAEKQLRAVPASEGAAAWAELIDRTVRGVGRSTRQWTAARRKDSLQRVLTGSRSDARKLQQRLLQLVASWDGPAEAEADAGKDAETPPTALAEPSDLRAEAAAEVGHASSVEPPLGAAAEAPIQVLDPGHADAQEPAPVIDAAPVDPAPVETLTTVWPRVVDALSHTVRSALPPDDARTRELQGTFEQLHGRLPAEVAQPELAEAFESACQRARRLLAHQHHLTDQLGLLARELTEGLSDLAEDDSWAQGQCQLMSRQLEEGLNSRSVRSVTQMLGDTRRRQIELRAERVQARDALKQAIHRMLSEIGELGAHTGRFEESIGRYADVIGQADSVESLAGIVREMVDETRTVHGLVAVTQQRLQDEHGRATELSDRVQVLEEELRKISQEVSTDPLTQIANRRGLASAFDTEQARARREGGPLAVGLLDIDNFKRLNDEMGHATGDAALVFLSERVQAWLRPGDTVGRWGGEEFVVLLPGTPVSEAQQVLTRLQRSLSSELFMHEGRQTFVTFSAGVTVWREGEPIEDTLQRSDEALYEAKRTGKNRTCIG